MDIFGKMKLKTEIEFDAAHRLENYDGKCANLHGHRWRVIIWVEGEKLDNRGILWDFTNAKEIEEHFDHKCLNDVMDVNPTAENIAFEILSMLCFNTKDLTFKVRVYESPKSYAEVTYEH